MKTILKSRPIRLNETLLAFGTPVYIKLHENASEMNEALKQFDYSLSLDPKHTKTLLNQGIVLAFAKQDLDGAASAWKKVVAIAPQSQEGQAAQRGLDGIAASRSGGTPPAGS